MGVPLTTLPVVVETTPMHALHIGITGAMEGTIVGAASPPVIATRVPSIARARM
jgi:hypothetical protein